jgi:hypothetical protein
MKKDNRTRKCFECKQVRDKSRFPKFGGLSNPYLCNNCRHSHRLDNKNKTYYPTTDENDEDVRVTTDDFLESLCD